MNEFNATSERNMRSRFELLLGGVAIVVTPPLVIISVPPSDRTLRRLGPPRLCQGARADHLTIPLEVRRHGPAAGKYDVHLTYKVGNMPHHVTVAAIAPEDIESAFGHVAPALAQHYVATARHVTVEKLEKERFFVVRPNGEFRDIVDEHLEHRRWRLRVSNAKLERLMEKFDVFDVAVIDELQAAGEHGVITLANEDSDAMLAVGYQPDGVGSGPPGWYAMPTGDGYGRLIDQIFTGRLSPGFFETLLVIARELQAEIDFDRIDDALARTRTRVLAIASPAPP